MILQSIGISQFRNLKHIQLALHPRCNVFVGDNGQGKTSILEALYILSRGKSFRTRLTTPLVQFECNEFRLKAETIMHEQLFLSKSSKGSIKAMLNDKRCQRLSQLSQLLPCQIFHQDLFQIIDASSEIRRRLIDWGIFYTQPESYSIWIDFKRVLMQRNSLLKQHASTQDLAIWNRTFVELSEKITQIRKDYILQLSEMFNSLLANVTDIHCELKYFNGWDKIHHDRTLLEVLIEQEAIDRKFQYTHSGPQHADLLFLTSHGKGKVEWSRGQQKIILIFLKLAQAKLLNRPCLFLLDDLAAELDEKHLDCIYNKLSETSGQFFITALNESAKNKAFFADSRWFYLKNGVIDQVVDL
jgi:DNA replication and repair protein RecF